MPRTPESRVRANAHVREKVPQAKQEAPAVGATRLLNDPELVSAFERLKAELVSRIEREIPSTPDSIELEREYCRQLRSLVGFKNALKVTLQMQTLREHDFRPKAPEKEGEK